MDHPLSPYNENDDFKIFFNNIIENNPLSLICYILWYHQFYQGKNDFSFRTDPFEFIYRYENKYTLMGEKVWDLIEKIKWFETNLVLMFEKESWTEITHRFHNFRSIETNQPSQTYDTYLHLHLTKKNYFFPESNDEQIIELPSSQHPLPKRYRPLSGGLAFGFLKNNNVTCFAAAPHIFMQEPFSYAILRGIETQSLDRRRGYAQKTVQVLCNALFNRFNVSDIYCWVEEKNRAARNLYKKIGFYEEGKIYSIYCDLKK